MPVLQDHMKLAHERILVIGDTDRQIQSAVMRVLPGAQVVGINGVFDGIAELASGNYTTVLAAAEPIERRPEPAVRTMRQFAKNARLMLFGSPSHESLSRKMLDFGVDDYLITPTSTEELQQMFGAPPLRIETVGEESPENESTAQTGESRAALLHGLPIANILLDAMLDFPHDAPGAAVKQINALIGPTMKLSQTTPSQPKPVAPEACTLLSHQVQSEIADAGSIHLSLPRDEDETAARHFLAQFGALLGKAMSLRDRHNRMQQLAITDELTGLHNGRFFKHFLRKIIEKARTMRFSVTLLLFDIDDFKKYNDQFGHGVGDEILRQTAKLIKRCCRQHDLVARISGDEFAVVFWEKEGPRQPRENSSDPPSRVPSSVRAVCERFRRLISSPEYQLLGTTGQGVLTISGGLAVYPFDAQTPEALIEAADRALMFDAKKGGKNTIFLVGDDQPENLGS
jgi:two-component system, cell cycle response regulator